MEVTVRQLFMKFIPLMAIGQGSLRVVSLILPESKMESLEFTFGYCLEHKCLELHIIDPRGLEKEDQHNIEEKTPFESMLDTDASEFWKKFGIEP